MWEEKQGGGLYLPVEVPVPTLVLLSATLVMSGGVCLSFLIYFCVLFASDTCLLQFGGSLNSLRPHHFSLQVTFMFIVHSFWSKTYLNIEEPYVGNVFAFFSVLNLILALTIPSAIFQNALSGVKLEKCQQSGALQSHD